ncbi:Hypothetical protein CAP_0181 [Chondromyces apiculatus DSM 436]|uniref:Uncharacterized protein n=1 Tax=Chondromyces apiculatus DSM 436 TaxID=1192034 RepID=A0A017TDQ6_9BACT|nr:Hypothetical protein CAP_0181 [Chondromyces apiculatus DSM 436]
MQQQQMQVGGRSRREAPPGAIVDDLSRIVKAHETRGDGHHGAGA